MEKALLVTIKLKSEADNWKIEDIALELEELVFTSGAEVVDNITCLREKPTANFFIGSGKAEELAFLCQEQDIDTVVFSHNLSGTQQRNLEETIGKKTIDRTQLILDIFALWLSLLLFLKTLSNRQYQFFPIIQAGLLRLF